MRFRVTLRKQVGTKIEGERQRPIFEFKTTTVRALDARSALVKANGAHEQVVKTDKTSKTIVHKTVWTPVEAVAA